MRRFAAADVAFIDRFAAGFDMRFAAENKHLDVGMADYSDSQKVEKAAGRSKVLILITRTRTLLRPELLRELLRTRLILINTPVAITILKRSICL